MLRSNIPFISRGGKLINLTDSVNIYYYGDLVFYQIPVIANTGTMEFDKKGTLEELHIDASKTSVSYEYFVYHKDSSLGYWFYSFKDTKRRSTVVDSFLKEQAFKGVGIYKDIYKDVQLETIKETGYGKIEKIIPSYKPDDSYADTIYLYFQRGAQFYNGDYSLSTQLDSLSEWKLVKSRFIYNSKISSAYHFPLPAKELWFEITPTVFPKDTAWQCFLEHARAQINISK